MADEEAEKLEWLVRQTVDFGESQRRDGWMGVRRSGSSVCDLC